MSGCRCGILSQRIHVYRFVIYSVCANKQPCCLFPRTNQKNVVRRTCLWMVVLTVLIIEERWHLMFNTEIFCEQIACSGDSVFMWGGDIMYGDYANMVKYFSLSFLCIIGLMLFLVFNKLSFLKNGVCQFNIIIISCFFFSWRFVTSISIQYQMFYNQ